ncbi:hypothetical protein DBR43_04815 [Pedobacter sp. KBW06]|uniref:hypothetical protein n=1 Tax=Pedobacter sp. KBW06 TaxID=2153359 RepID=UPI000F5A966F|nr:hypothetical protein [Pedobacter sp. KBW06]RQO74710.1 hypothetical protein DBR43_04815 [Pedobacter sp. KBW06]
MKSAQIIKHYLILLLFPLIISCQNPGRTDYKYTEQETAAFLNDITKYAGASISSYTESKKALTNEFYITTRYPLSKPQLEEYKKNNGTVHNKTDDISDFTSYTVKDYELLNEKNEKLQFADNGQATYLQEMNLVEYDKILFQNLGIEVKLNKQFEKLKGSITVEFEMPGNIRRTAKIPVNISIYDEAPESF